MENTEECLERCRLMSQEFRALEKEYHSLLAADEANRQARNALKASLIKQMSATQYREVERAVAKQLGEMKLAQINLDEFSTAEGVRPQRSLKFLGIARRFA